MIFKWENLPALVLGPSERVLNQLGVLGFLGGGENKGGVGGGILGLVLGDSCRLGKSEERCYG